MSGPAPDAAGGVYDAVLVCAGPRCGDRAEEVVDALRQVVRAASTSVLVRTECQARCRVPGHHAGPHTADCEVLMQRVDAHLRPAGHARRVAPALPTPLVRSEVARWLMRAEPER